MGKKFAEVNIGDTYQTASRTVTEGVADMLVALGGFTAAFFSSAERAKNKGFKGKIIPGPLTVSLMRGLNEQRAFFDEDDTIAMTSFEIKFLKPLYPGDTIYCRSEVIEKRFTSNKTRGIIRTKTQCISQRNEVIVETQEDHLHFV